MTLAPERYRRARRAGFIAGASGKPVSVCPYVGYTERAEAWREAWRMGREVPEPTRSDPNSAKAIVRLVTVTRQRDEAVALLRTVPRTDAITDWLRTYDYLRPAAE